MMLNNFWFYKCTETSSLILLYQLISLYGEPNLRNRKIIPPFSELDPEFIKPIGL